MTGQDEVSALMALGAPPSPAAAESLGQEQLGLVVEQAIQQLQAAGLDAAQLVAFRHVQVVIADLSGLELGLATRGAIVLDVNAAGYGWHTDKDEVRRIKDESASVSSFGLRPSSLGMDLLTAVMHELGHAAGLADQYGDLDSADVMSGWLRPGTRRLPALADLDAVFGDGDWLAD